MNPFIAKSREEEIEILTSDTPDFARTKSYIDALINAALAHFAFSEIDLYLLRQEMEAQIPTAARHYLRNENPDFKFSTYFTWYIARSIDRYFHIRRKEA